MIALINAPMPVRNLYALTEHLRLNGHTPIPHVVNTRAPDYPIGHSDAFWVLNTDTDHYFQASATIVCETPHLYLYVQSGIRFDRAAACAAAHLFEDHIYPTDRHTFGSEWIPGVDDDPHITVFYGTVPGVGGYYAGEDEYPRIVNRFSNQREILFINAANALGTAAFGSTLAHEFQHMIHWHMHPRDEAWLNEGASMLAQKINGYSVDGVDQAYARTPDVQLDAWSDTTDVDAHYGAGFLWMDYLYERFGRSFIHEMLADHRYSSFPLVDDVLHKLGIKLTASQIFADWAVANTVNDRAALGARYGYRNTGIHAKPLATFGDGALNYRARIHPYAPIYLSFSSLKRARTLSFHGTPTIPLIGAGQRAPFWWSNRCDFCDMTMTRPLDLRKTHKPVLAFSTWYDIEKNYDYAYVEVSNNSGLTWQTLPSAVTTKANPNGDNFGNGITGQSWRDRANEHAWRQVRIDLSRYAGKRVLLRFEYITDDEYNGQSWAVRDIAVHDCWKGGVCTTLWQDRVGDPAWTLHGFVPVMRNIVPNTWTLQLITFGRGAPVVHPILVDAAGNAHFTLGRGGAHATLVVFSQAAKTTLTSSFHLWSP
jgi:immune inhibitor A